MGSIRIFATGALLGGALAPALAQAADNGAAGDGDNDEGAIVVSGVRSVVRDKLAKGALDTPQSLGLR